MNNFKLQPGKSPARLRYTYIRKKLSLTLLLSICFLCFLPYSQPTNAGQSKPLMMQSKQFLMEPEDMVQNGYYYFSDHGNGMSVAKFDRMEGDNIYTFASIKPLLASFSGPGLWGTVTDAGSIRLATVTEIIQLLLSIAAGAYVPYP